MSFSSHVNVCATFPRYFLFSFFCSFGIARLGRRPHLDWLSVISTTPSLLISCFSFVPVPFRAFVVVLMSCGCQSRVWRSTVAFVSRNISSLQCIESSTPGLPSMHGAFVLFRTSLPPTAPRSVSLLCYVSTLIKFVLSSCITSSSSARCSSP